MIPSRYNYLLKAPGATALVNEFLDLLGTVEGEGGTNNPTILRWADEVVKAVKTPYTEWAADWYNSDAIAWCGLAQAVACVRASTAKNRLPPKNYLSALAWAAYGVPVQWRGREGLRLNEILVGDIAVFVRNGGGHVGTVVGITTDGKNLLILGGNQDNRVSIAQKPVSRLYAVRRPPYKVRPAGARHVRVTSTGIVDNKEG